VPQFPPPQRPILQKDEVFFVGDPILALAAVDETTAADALEKVKIGPALVAEATRPT
jgi:CO/xanthine dehydrogenase Mo-binding subunit